MLWLDDARWPISCGQLDGGLSGHDYEFLHDQQGTAKAILLGRLETRHANGAAKKHIGFIEDDTQNHLGLKKLVATMGSMMPSFPKPVIILDTP